MQLSISSGYVKDTGDPAESLKAAADAGFTHIHWTHQWNADFIYTESEIKYLCSLFDDYGLQLLDMHGALGPEKNWYSEKEHERQAGVELTINRMELTARLGGDVVVMHTGSTPITDPLKKSLDELEPFSKKLGVKIAVENGIFDYLKTMTDLYSSEYLGLCYDSGHANMESTKPDKLEEFRDRLFVIHLHDNNGIDDQHKIPFMGTINWQKVIARIANTSYTKGISLEVSQGRSGIEDTKEFLRLSYQKAEILGQMLENERKKLS